MEVRKEIFIYFKWMKSFPICIHVNIHSAGVGRTGTYICLDAMMERLKKRDDLNIFECVSIFEFVSEMRTQRMKMVQTLVSRTSSDAYSVTCITLLKFNILYTPQLILTWAIHMHMQHF